MVLWEKIYLLLWNLQVREYIDDTEDYVNIQLDNQRNELIQLQLTLTIASFAIAVETLIAGMFGMNILVNCTILKGYLAPSLELLLLPVFYFSC